MVVGCLIGNASSQGQIIVYVDATATGPVHDGSSWCTAFTSLSEATDIATDGVEIRVAQGVYVPDTSAYANPRRASFTIAPGVTIAGGYWGCTGVDPNLRNTGAFTTILSGDVLGDDMGDANMSDNCYHVVQSSNFGIATRFPSLLSGVTVTAGNADGLGFPSGDAVGAGVYSVGVMTVEDCLFERNRAIYAAGMFNLEGSPIVSGCEFRDNRATWAGALALFGYGSVSATSSGDAVGFVAHGNPRIVDTRFEDNRAEQFAGALWVQGYLTNPTVTNCVFERNTAGAQGGAMLLLGTEHHFQNCLFFKNSAGESGGAGRVSGTAHLVNCSVVDNHAMQGGGFHFISGQLSVLDSILWDNHSSDPTIELQQISGSAPSLDHTCVEGWSGQWGGLNNTSDDPLFVSGPAGCLYLSQSAAGQQWQSPCVDSGSTSAVIAGLSTMVTRLDEVADSGVVDRGYHYSMTGRTLMMGDADSNSHIDLRDVAVFQHCFAGDAENDISPCCTIFDFQWDRTVAFADFLTLIQLLDAPG